MSTANGLWPLPGGLWPLPGGPWPPRSCLDRAQSPTTPAELDAACLTLCQAWIAAGRPRGARSIGSFEAWSQVIGGILEIAGVDGFLGNLDEMLAASDAEGAVWRPLIQAWWDRFGTTEVGVSDLYPVALNTEPPFPLGDGSDRSQRTRLGNALGRVRDRAFRIDGRLFRVQATRIVHQAQRFRLVVEAVADVEKTAPAAGDSAAEGNLGGNLGNLGEQGSPPQAQEIPGVGEPWEPGEPFPYPYARAHAHAKIKKVEKGSQGSPGSPERGNTSVSGGEPGWEPGRGGSQPTASPHWLDGVP
jgi:hypothetical protein